MSSASNTNNELAQRALMNQMSRATALVGTEWGIVALALIFVVTRVVLRVRQYRRVKPADYLVILGFLAALACVICETMNWLYSRKQINFTHADDQKVEFAFHFFYDVGLYLPKISILLFFDLIPEIFTWLRAARLTIFGVVCFCATSALLLDLLWCRPITTNWDENDATCSIATSLPVHYINWSMNISCDVLIFILPFFLLPKLTLPLGQFIGLAVVFLLGLITMAVSIARFSILRVQGESPDCGEDGGGCDTQSTFHPEILSVAEISTAVIVVCLPSLRRLIGKSPTNRYLTVASNNHGLCHLARKSGSRHDSVESPAT